MKIKLFKVGVFFYLARKMKRGKGFDFLFSILVTLHYQLYFFPSQKVVHLKKQRLGLSTIVWYHYEPLVNHTNTTMCGNLNF
jgi:hypothetical protein